MINKVILLGNVGNDPEVKYVSEGVAVARFRLATSESFTNKNSERVTNTEWHNIVLWRGLAKVVEQYVKKGATLYIEGKITNRSYEKDGDTRYFTEIVADQMKMVGGKRSDGSTDYQPQPANTNTGTAVNDSAPAYEIPSSPADDLPF